MTVTLMATATGLTGLVPSYAAIGIFAPILLVLCRLLQGFSTGGEWGGAASFMVEYAPPGRRGFYGSLQQVSTGFGQLLSITMALTLSSLLDQQTLGDWGWRIPFIVGFLLAPVGYYLRSRVSDDCALAIELEFRARIGKKPRIGHLHRGRAASWRSAPRSSE